MAGHELLRQHTRMIFNMGRRSHMRTQVHDIGRASHVFQCSVLLQLLRHGHDIHRPLTHVQRLDSLVDFLVTGLVESLRAQNLADDGESVLVNHQRTQHRLLHIERLRLQMAVTVVNRSDISFFGHNLSVNGLQI